MRKARSGIGRDLRVRRRQRRIEQELDGFARRGIRSISQPRPDLLPGQALFRLERLRGGDGDPAARHDLQRGVRRVDGEPFGGVAEIISQFIAPGRRERNRKVAGHDALHRRLARRQMCEMAGVGHRLPVAVGRAMTDVVLHHSTSREGAAPISREGAAPVRRRIACWK